MTTWRLVRAGAVLAALTGSAAVAQDEPFDVLVRGGQIIDGTGRAPFAGDVALRGARVAAMGSLPQARARTIVDATGRYVTPGFIDVHSHAGEGLSGDLQHGQPVLAQGITTVVVNPDGGGAGRPRRPTRDLRVAAASAPNVALFVPHGIGARGRAGHGGPRRRRLPSWLADGRS